MTMERLTVASANNYIEQSQTKGITPPAAENITYCLQNSNSTHGYVRMH
jgi:hypothetical protein